MINLEEYQTSIENFLAENKWGANPPSLYEPIQYIMALRGKRLRPLLALMSYSLYKKDVERIIPYAAAIEVFHNFTLMHDDIMDQAPLRRGKKTVHQKWNVNTAILSGDVMMVKVYEIFSKLDPKLLKEVLPLFNTCATEVCEGQQWDMEFESKKNVTVSNYLDMIRQKTAVLLGFSLELGAVLAGAKMKDRIALRSLGINMGIGFQLNDDLLDVYGDQKKFGKQVGGDIISNKKTFLLIKAIELAKGKDKIALQNWIKSKNFQKKEKVQSVTALYNKLEIGSITAVEINNFFNTGLRDLQTLPDSLAKDEIAKFIFALMKRQH